MNKIVQTNSDLQKQLKDQLELLTLLAENYDKGSEVAAKAMATTIRVLVHDTASSTSLLDQLGMKSQNFFDTCAEKGDSVTEGMMRVGSFAGLLGVPIGGPDSGKYIPHLDDTPPGQGKHVPFEEFWNREIFSDDKGSSFTRKDIVLQISNKDGGAHVDPELDKKYVQLSRENSLGWKTSNDGENWTSLAGAELAAVRQIGHEILRTLVPDYPKKKMVTRGAVAVMGGMGIRLGMAPKKSSPADRPAVAGTIPRDTPRNAKCPCGSMRRYKNCHADL